MTNLAAGLVSLALIGGVGVWGYKLMMRDVTGIPIVRAVTGDARVLPEEPGGELARNQGLAVNMVAAEGGAEAPAEQLILAPQPVALTDEDMPMSAEAVALVQQALADQAALDGVEPARHQLATAEGETSEAIDKIVATLTQNIEPLEPAAGVQLASATPATMTDALGDLPGVRASLRPKLRPDLDTAALIAASIQLSAPPAAEEIDPDSLPAGTRLVQLGAYDSAEQAASEWEKITGRFDVLMADKAQVIQQASSGGREFYRLRAHGFEDLADARRFCSALLAEGADCIPVTTR